MASAVGECRYSLQGLNKRMIQLGDQLFNLSLADEHLKSMRKTGMEKGSLKKQIDAIIVLYSRFRGECAVAEHLIVEFSDIPPEEELHCLIGKVSTGEYLAAWGVKLSHYRLASERIIKSWLE